MKTVDLKGLIADLVKHGLFSEKMRLILEKNIKEVEQKAVCHKKCERAIDIIDAQILFFENNPTWGIWKNNVAVAVNLFEEVVKIVNGYIAKRVSTEDAMNGIVHLLRAAEATASPAPVIRCGNHASNLAAYLQKLRETIKRV